MDSQTVIRTENVVRRFGSTVALDGLDLEVKEGTIYGFLGRNGAGKTTTIKMLAALLRPDKGTVEVFSEDPWEHSVETKQRIGYLSETQVLFPWMRVEEIIRFCSNFYPKWDFEYTRNMLDSLGLDENKKIRHLSKGQQRQVGLILALSHHPDLLLLDEPAGGLDTVVRRDFLKGIIDLIQEHGKTVFISSHILTDIERVIDHVGIIDEGKMLVSGAVDDLKETVKRVRFGFRDGDMPEVPLPQVLKTRTSGNDMLVTVRDPDVHAIREFAEAHNADFEIIDLNLEELFIDFVG
jgi:ABC-2 type transport system ATP-binding protein